MLNTVTLHPKGQLNSDNSNANSYWNDHGAVGGTFAAVGIVAVGLLAALGWFLWRRHKAKRMDRDVVAAASAAAATTRTPFDDDDEEMGQAAHYPQSHVGAAPYHHSPDGTGSSPYYDSPGYHAPNHYASTELPRAYPSAAEDPYASELGARENAMEYYSNASGSRANIADRGAYSNVPTDSAYSYNRPLYDSMPGAPPIGMAGTAGLAPIAAAAYQNPFLGDSRAPTDGGNSDRAAPQPSERTSTSTDYDMARSQADSHATHFTNAPEALSTSGASGAHSVPPPPVRPVAFARGTPSESPFADPAPNPYMGMANGTPPFAGASAPAVSDAKTRDVGAQEPAQLVQFSQPSPEVQNGAQPPFNDPDHSDGPLDHGDWDPPALSSAWFPHGAGGDAPAAPPTTSTHTSQQPQHSIGQLHEAETASVEHAPSRLVVRNPSPEDAA